jgi:hypothetical protein
MHRRDAEDAERRMHRRDAEGELRRFLCGLCVSAVSFPFFPDGSE